MQHIWRSLTEFCTFGKAGDYFSTENNYILQLKGLKIKGFCTKVIAPEAVICLVHGFGEHSGRYREWAERFKAKKIAFASYDLPGHGESGGRRGHTPDFDFLLDAIKLSLHKVEGIYPGVPIFLYGHSMGGNLVANYVLERRPRNLAGIILTSPWFSLAFAPPALKLWAGKIASEIFPTYTEESKLDTAGLSSDPEVGKKYVTDPLVHTKITARLFREIYKAGRRSVARASDIYLPLLLMHGQSDPITSLASSQRFADKVSESFIRFKTWPGMRHELHNEVKKEAIFTEIYDFIQEKKEAETGLSF